MRADEGRILLSHVSERDGGWPSAERRTVAELRALGLDVEESSSLALDDCSDEPTTRERIQQLGAVGAVELRRSKGGLRVCVVELITGKATMRHLELAADAEPDRAAIWAVELVHASLLELRASHPSRGEITPPHEVRRAVDSELKSSDAASFGLRLGAQGFPLGGEVSVGPAAGFSLKIARLVFDTDATIGIVPASVQGGTGSADLRVTVGRAHAEYRFINTRRFTVGAGLGPGFILVNVEGRAQAPYRSATGVATSWLASSLFEAAVSVTPSFWVRADAHAGYCIRPIRVSFAGGSSIELGKPLLDAGAYLEWRPN